MLAVEEKAKGRNYLANFFPSSRVFIPALGDASDDCVLPAPTLTLQLFWDPPLLCWLETAAEAAFCCCPSLVPTPSGRV